MNKKTVVLFPSFGLGHLIPMVELAKLFSASQFSVAIPIFDSPYAAASTIDAFTARVSAAYPSISFHRLASIPIPPHLSNSQPKAFQLLRFANPQLSSFLTSLLSRTSGTISALVIDMFCTAALDVGNELNLPTYLFFASSASTLAIFASFPAIQSQMDCSLKDLGDAPLHFRSFPPIPASHFPPQLQDRDDDAHKSLVYHLERLPTASGIIVNSFDALEPRAVKAIAEGLSVPMPPVHCVGPLIADWGEVEGERHACLTWLDAQPEGSVLFLCFGSMGAFSAEQLREIATALERSGLRFLWVVRAPPSKASERVVIGPRQEPDLRALIPEGFWGRTEGRGMVMKSWAPQADVLRHGSVGGFVSHCGWNSTLEAVSAGVPMIAWPLYAEQKFNRMFMIEAGLAVGLEGSDGEAAVRAEEIQRKVRLLMESEEGKEMRERVAAMRESAAAAREKGGSSDAAWMDLVRRMR